MKTYFRKFRWIIVMVFLMFSPLPSFSQSSVSQKREAWQHFQRAEEALRDNKPNEAVNEFQEVLRLDPSNVDARANLGVIAFFSGDYQKAAQQFRAALRLQPSLWKAQALLGMCEKRLGRMGKAQTLLQSSFSHLQEEKLRLRAGMDLVEIDYQLGEFAKAGDLLETLRRLSPADVNVLYTSYRIYSKLAFQAMESLAMVAPDSARMHELIAERLINNADLGNAIRQYRKALQLDPKLPGIHYELGEAIMQQSTSPPSLEEAKAEFNAELAINPAAPNTECKLGQIDMLQSNLKGAFEHYSRAAQLNPNDIDAQIGLGDVLARTGRRQEAFKCYRSAERLNPVNETAHYRLATIYRQMGKKADADREMSTFERLREMKQRVIHVFQQMHQQVGGAVPKAPR